MPKANKTPDIISAIKHPSLFGSLTAFQSLDSWAAWLTWLKAVFALEMNAKDLEIYRQCTGRTDTPAVTGNQELDDAFHLPLINGKLSIYRPGIDPDHAEPAPIITAPRVAPREVYMVSSRRSGVLYEAHRDFFGKSDQAL
jgi:hypothetical protein